MPNWKDLFSSTDRRQYPEVVVPLEYSHAPEAQQPSPVPDAEKKPDADDTSNTSVDRASSQEKGIASAPGYSSSALEVLRGKIESEVSVSGQDSVYDRMSLMSNLADWLRPRQLG